MKKSELLTELRNFNQIRDHIEKLLGKRITTITRLMDIEEYKHTVSELLANPPLVLV